MLSTINLIMPIHLTADPVTWLPCIVIAFTILIYMMISCPIRCPLTLRSLFATSDTIIMERELPAEVFRMRVMKDRFMHPHAYKLALKVIMKVVGLIHVSYGAYTVVHRVPSVMRLHDSTMKWQYDVMIIERHSIISFTIDNEDLITVMKHDDDLHSHILMLDVSTPGPQYDRDEIMRFNRQDIR